MSDLLFLFVATFEEGAVPLKCHYLQPCAYDVIPQTLSRNTVSLIIINNLMILWFNSRVL